MYRGSRCVCALLFSFNFFLASCSFALNVYSSRICDRGRNSLFSLADSRASRADCGRLNSSIINNFWRIDYFFGAGNDLHRMSGVMFNFKGISDGSGWERPFHFLAM